MYLIISEELTVLQSRVCPGRHLAENSLFSLVSSILATFNITKKLDEHGNELPLKYEFSKGLIRWFFNLKNHYYVVMIFCDPVTLKPSSVASCHDHQKRWNWSIQEYPRKTDNVMFHRETNLPARINCRRQQLYVHYCVLFTPVFASNHFSIMHAWALVALVCWMRRRIKRGRLSTWIFSAGSLSSWLGNGHDNEKKTRRTNHRILLGAYSSFQRYAMILWITCYDVLFFEAFPYASVTIMDGPRKYIYGRMPIWSWISSVGRAPFWGYIWLVRNDSERMTF